MMRSVGWEFRDGRDDAVDGRFRFGIRIYFQHRVKSVDRVDNTLVSRTVRVDERTCLVDDRECFLDFHRFAFRWILFVLTIVPSFWLRGQNFWHTPRADRPCHV